MNAFDELERMFGGSKCPRCGNSGLHACTGSPAKPWTDEERAHLENALRDMFKEEEDAAAPVTDKAKEGE